MLIKKKKLANIKSLHRVPLPPSEAARAAQLEVQKAKQEAKIIKDEAEKVLLEAQTKLLETQKKAAEIIQNTHIEAKNIKEKVYRETLDKAIQESEVMKNEAKELLHELFEVKRKALEQVHGQIINVALDLATKILRYQASVDPDVLKVQVVEAIKKATTEADRVQVFVNPVDLKALQESTTELLNLFPKGVDIVPLAKESVDPGSCIVETKSGQLDASFSTQLSVLTNLLKHIEVKEPQITIDETIPEQLVSDVAEFTEEGLTLEEEMLKEELFSEEPIIQLPEEETKFQFEEATTAPQVSDIPEIPKEVFSPPKEEDVLQKKKKIVKEELFERTKEEMEELDGEEQAEEENKLVFEYEDDEEELEEEKEEAIDISSILKPKKKPSTQVSDIASELEKSPEWKDLLQGEDEE